MIAGYVIAHGSQVPLPCTVRDHNQTGARLELEHHRGTPRITAASLPDHITLFWCPDRVEIACRIVWRDGRHLGVRYVGPRRPSALALS